jgi:hypothetical protein
VINEWICYVLICITVYRASAAWFDDDDNKQQFMWPFTDLFAVDQLDEPNVAMLLVVHIFFFFFFINLE